MSRSIACIDYRDGKLFIAKRQQTGDMGGRWEFPGGKLDEGESEEDAIRREMREEFGVETEILGKITTGTFEHKGRRCSLEAYRVRFAHDGLCTPFVLSEHTEYKWVPPEEIPALNFVDSDLKIYPAVMEAIKNEA